MRLFISIVVMGFGLLATSVSADSVSGTNNISVQLCDWWKYEFDLHSYSCNSTTQRVTLVEARDYERKIRELEARLVRLEAKLGQLEN